jgi:hypothetical protein
MTFFKCHKKPIRPDGSWLQYMKSALEFVRFWSSHTNDYDDHHLVGCGTMQSIRYWLKMEIAGSSKIWSISNRPHGIMSQVTVIYNYIETDHTLHFTSQAQELQKSYQHFILFKLSRTVLFPSCSCLKHWQNLINSPCLWFRETMNDFTSSTRKTEFFCGSRLNNLIQFDKK